MGELWGDEYVDYVDQPQPFDAQNRRRVKPIVHTGVFFIGRMATTQSMSGRGVARLGLDADLAVSDNHVPPKNCLCYLESQ